MRGMPETGLHEDGVGTLFARAVADAKDVAHAEIALQKARALAKVREAQSAVIMLLAALVLGSMVLTALVVGALLILQRPLGPIWATVIVVGVLVVSAGLLGWLAISHFKTVFGAST